MKHPLNIKEQYLKNLLNGTKKAEIRINDRDYQVGDLLEFWDDEKGRTVFFEITHIHSGLGMEEYYVVLSVKLI